MKHLLILILVAIVVGLIFDVSEIHLFIGQAWAAGGIAAGISLLMDR